MDFITDHLFTKEYVNNSFRNWDYNRPVVYILRGNIKIYIGETTNAYKRINNHLKNNEKSEYLNKMIILYDQEYNKSATLDIESKLIQYIAAESNWILQNKNDGLRDHNYFDREKYLAKFKTIWDELKKRGIVYKELNDIENSDLFKYSPYKALNYEQYEVVSDIFEQIISGNFGTFLIKGEPGTGKSVVASFLIKYLIGNLEKDLAGNLIKSPKGKRKKDIKDIKIGLVVPMAGLRKTFKKVFKNIDGLKPSMVIGPNDLAKDYSKTNKATYDIIIVDESHRLQKRRNITNYKSYDDVNKKLGLPLESTQLDWVLALSKTQILLYDSNQSIKPADVNKQDFYNLNIAKHYELKSQMRVKGGNEYLNFINNIFDVKDNIKLLSEYNFNIDDAELKLKGIIKYEFKIFDDFKEFRNIITEKDKEFGLSRIVAGYARPWKSKRNPNEHDIEIDGIKMFWNSTNIDWVNSSKAINEIGCIHTVQGYDLNYVGVIIGDELSFDESSGELIINNKNYYDRNGKRGIIEMQELKQYIINIYKTLLTRGILGTYVYIVDEKLREYFKKFLN